MKIKVILILGVVLIVIGVCMCVYPHIEFYSDNHLYMMSYSKNWEESEDVDQIEQEFCYDESYAYNRQRDITIVDWEYENFWIFRWFKINYQRGNICSTEYLLEESYIKDFLERAIIEENEDNVNLGKLIAGKKVIVGNKRYPYDENRKYIGYKLDGKYMDMFVWENEEGLLIIQVGLGDEGPKYIAYK